MFARSPGSSSAAAAPALSFPRVGDDFTSASSFKLAAYRACLANAVSPSPRVGAAAHAYIRCRLTTLSTRDDPAATDSGGGRPCTFLISASNRLFGKGLAPVTVVDAVFEHSCPAGARGAYFAEFEGELEERIARMEETVRREEDEARRREAASAASAEEEERAARTGKRRARAARLEGEERRRASGAGPGRRKSVAMIDLTAADSEDEDDDSGVEEGVVRARFPAAADVQPVIDQLVENGTVDFPEPTDTFASASALLALLYAYAQQRSFTLYRNSDAYSPIRARLRCGRGHHRFADKPGGRCSMTLVIKRNRLGRWFVDESQLEHSHELSGETRRATFEEETVSARPHKRGRPAAASSSPSPPRQQPRASTSGWSAVHETPEPAAGDEPHCLDRHEQDSPPRFEPRPPLPDDVAMFLAGALPHLGPPLVDSVTAALTQCLGLSTAGDVVDFLSLEPDSVVAMEEQLRLHDGYEDCAWSLVDLQEGLRAAHEPAES
ncbi:hypothetical protein JCM9279_004617 [Rhodotorula babjevae]